VKPGQRQVEQVQASERIVGRKPSRPPWPGARRPESARSHPGRQSCARRDRTPRARGARPTGTPCRRIARPCAATSRASSSRRSTSPGARC
jgi:hypothetical protein